VGQSKAVTHRWYAPSGTGDGSTNTAPLGFSAADFNAFLTNSGETEFVIHFLPSTTNYNVETALVIPDRHDLASLKISIIGEGDFPEEVRLINTTPTNSSISLPNPDYIIALNTRLPASGTNPPVTASQLIVENLLLDGNWAGKMAMIGHPALAQGYKNAPLNLSARTGAVRKVIVRNFGAIGYAPWSHYGGMAGVETFPFVVSGDDLGQVPPTGWRRPWVVEDCEIHGFNGPFSGYTTQLMASGKTHGTNYTPAWIGDDPDRRFVLARNVQIRSEGDGSYLIATGNAGIGGGGGRTTFIDNIILNNSLGYNADTGPVRYVDIHNSIGLNVWWWANIHSHTTNYFRGFHIGTNSVRFGPMATYPKFTSFCWDSSAKPYTDPSLILGRWETNTLFTLANLGSIHNVWIDNNWLSTIPGSAFDETGGGITNGQFRLVRTIPSRTGASCIEPPLTYPGYTNLVIGTNKLSDYAHAFYPYGSSLTTPGTYTNVANASPPSELQMERPILQDMFLGPPTSFGRIGRVLPYTYPLNRDYKWKTDASTVVTQSFTDSALLGAWELSLAKPEVGATSVSILTHFERQHTPAYNWETLWGDGSLIWLTTSGLVTNSQWAVADGLGDATFDIPITSGSHGEIFVTAFHDPRATNGASGAFSIYQVAYATGIIPIGTVVSVKPHGEVAVDRHEDGVQTGRFRLHRSGSTVSNLTVNFTLPTGFRPATLTTDYTLGAVSPASWSSGGATNTFTFASGQAYADLVVTPVADETIERELVHLQIVGGSNYAVSQGSGSASIYIYDGPEWTLYEVTHSGDPYSGATIGVGLSSDVTSGGAPNPMIAANFLTSRTVLVPPGYWVLGSGYQGGGWFEDLTDLEYVFDVTQLPAVSPIATGVSNGARDAYFPGYKGESSGQTRALRGYRDTWTYLNPPGTGWLAEKNRALCISPDGTLIGGYATRTQSSPAVDEQQPVFWTNSTFVALFSGTGLEAGRSGEARAVNNAGEFVGHRVLQMDSTTNYIPRAFRSRVNGATVLDSDMLVPPDQEIMPDHADIQSVALDISAPVGAYSGIAVGWGARFSDIGEWLPRPVIWWSRTNGSPEPDNGSFLPVTTEEGKVNAIRSAKELYGQVSDSGGANPQAWRWPNGWTHGHGFSDKFMVYGYENEWLLKEIVDVSDAGLLLGNGTKNSSSRAFLLVPQSKID